MGNAPPLQRRACRHGHRLQALRGFSQPLGRRDGTRRVRRATRRQAPEHDRPVVCSGALATAPARKADPDDGLLRDPPRRLASCSVSPTGPLLVVRGGSGRRGSPVALLPQSSSATYPSVRRESNGENASARRDARARQGPGLPSRVLGGASAAADGAALVTAHVLAGGTIGARRGVAGIAAFAAVTASCVAVLLLGRRRRVAVVAGGCDGWRERAQRPRAISLHLPRRLIVRGRAHRRHWEPP
jgi:hypothetical protein